MRYITISCLLMLFISCSKITDPGAVVSAPGDNGIAVIGFTGSACTNCLPSHNVVWYDVVKVEDTGSNITSVPDRINLKVKDDELQLMFSFKPYRTVLTAKKTGKYWKLISITKN